MDWRNKIELVRHCELRDHSYENWVANLAELGARIRGAMVMAGILDWKESVMEPLPGQQDPQRHPAEGFRLVLSENKAETRNSDHDASSC